MIFLHFLPCSGLEVDLSVLYGIGVAQGQIHAVGIQLTIPKQNTVVPITLDDVIVLEASPTDGLNGSSSRLFLLLGVGSLPT